MPSLYSLRTAFDKRLMAEIGQLRRGTAWKKSGEVLFRIDGRHFVSASVTVHRDAARTTVRLAFKPMDLDPLVWRILGMSENERQPPSFRAHAAFQGDALPILEEDLETEGQSPEEVARALFAWLARHADLHTQHLAIASFADLVSRHPNQVARGAHAVTLVASLILEGRRELAAQVARRYASAPGLSVVQVSTRGGSFHDLALRWIESGA